MLVIIDFDSPVYAACLSIKSQVDKGELEGSDRFIFGCIKHQIDRTIDKIVEQTGADEYLVIISGKENFRYDIYPDYKANRRHLEKPPYFNEARSYVIKKHSAYVTTDGQESDDFCHIYMKAYDEGEIIVSHIDKDLNLIVGKHHNFRSGEVYDVDEKQAMHNFYMQILTGDSIDNIPGLFKLTGKKATKKIKEGLLKCETESKCWEYTRETFAQAVGCDTSLYIGQSGQRLTNEIIRSARCLWLQSEEGEIWEPPV